jgi:predicted signal transduction protein with EAL and GGDEF domain
MFRCLVATGTEPTPGARAQEPARLASQFIGDMCVVAPASEDRRSFDRAAVESRDARMTEAGSFSSLRQLPIDYLRIDGEFVGGIARSPVDREIVRAIVLLARAVGRRTIAELVPDQETPALLGELGVDLVQGFHIGRPRPVEELR